MRLPDELWESILCVHGPLALLRDPTRAAAVRIQRAWRARPRLVMEHGMRVAWKFRRPQSDWYTGTIAVVRLDGEQYVCVQRDGKKYSYLFLPHPMVIVQRVGRRDRCPPSAPGRARSRAWS